MKILVTGGCGYIGSHTIVDLVENGFDVVSIDACFNSHESAIQGVEKIVQKEIKNYSIDLCNYEVVKQIFEAEKFDGIIHFAAFKSVPESVENPLKYYHNNLTSLLNLLKLTEEFKVKHFVFSSSCSVYGNTKELPVTEETPFEKAESPYAHTKQLGENIIEEVAQKSASKFVLLRYFNPVGAHESALIGELPTVVVTAVVPRITGFAAGKFKSFSVMGTDYPTRDGTCVRDYIHVMDIAHAHTKAIQYLVAEKQTLPCDIFNLGTGNGVTVLEAINSFEKVSGLKLNYQNAPRREGDVVSIYANNNKAKNLLGWTPKRDLDNMMLTAWNWEQKQE
ncbi:MAG: UDP-glucose 4-epimerase GalE [Chitinophagales bacterium]|nr:UDP-glucose 4-epimerase GalE [Chitinophagales bacterium]MCO5280753.1 UDP-glucose 4-epimerase GalE [Chitinophagales bacterium]OJV29823.1 MAG: UDP-glucose 4-epimerase GalE [Bacteroidetes bacterium 37-13]HRN93336.1 UDP-glucose 4-epimerase GalE [Chitinophagales bacterium]HRP38971.1 UDP-glucose 4-epimerase GalE [Chitinophagales bacterium]